MLPRHPVKGFYKEITLRKKRIYSPIGRSPREIDEGIVLVFGDFLEYTKLRGVTNETKRARKNKQES